MITRTRRTWAAIGLAALALAVVPAGPVQAVLPSNPWKVQNGTVTHYVRETSTTFASITAKINSNWYTSRGFGHIRIYCPYSASSAYRGTPAVDFFTTNPNTGTVADFKAMTTAAHDKGIAVSMYISLLFVDPTNALWTTAQQQVGAGQTTATTKLFRFSTTNTGPVAGNGGWAFSTVAGKYYATSWGRPALDYANVETRNYAKSVLKFWMDQGVDGFQFDDAFSGLGMSQADLTDITVTTPTTYTPGVKILEAEGSGIYTLEAQNNAVGYTHIQIHGDNDTVSFPTEVMAGTKTASNLEAQFVAYADPRRATATRGVSGYSLYSTTGYNGDQRALDAAVQAGNGVLYEIDYDQIYATLSAADQAKYDTVFRTIASTTALAPNASRARVSTGTNAKYYATIRTSADGTKTVLGVFNFSAAAATIPVDLTGTNVTIPQTPTNVITGAAAAAISSTSYPVTLPAYGYAFLAVIKSGGTPPPPASVTTDDGAAGWTYAGGWSAYAEPAAYLGTAHGGDTLGASGAFTFTGTSVEVYGWTGPDGGALNVFVDNVLRGSASQVSATDVQGVRLFNVTGLTSGTHTVSIRQTNATGTGWTNIDYIKTSGSGGTPPPPASVTTDDGAAGWTYAGGWSAYAEPAAYLGTAHGGDTLGASGAFTFTGTSVEVYGWTGPDGGALNVFVDNVLRGSASQVSATDVQGVRLFNVTGLTSGTHTVSIRQTNATGTGWTNIDYIKTT